MSSNTGKSRKQFDLSHLQIDEQLQGSKLASFTRRSMAFGIDWLIILLCTEYFSLIIPLALVFLFFKKRLRARIVKSRRMLRKNVNFADRKLEDLKIDEKLRHRFRRHMTVYLYLIIYVPLLLAGLVLAAFIISVFSVDTYDTAKASLTSSFAGLFQPLTDLNNAFRLLINFLGAFVYFTFFTWQWHGSTPGKRLTGIKVLRLNGKPLTFWGSLERATGYTASASLLGIGFLQYFWDRNCQATHDKITETVVVEA